MKEAPAGLQGACPMPQLMDMFCMHMFLSVLLWPLYLLGENKRQIKISIVGEKARGSFQGEHNRIIFHIIKNENRLH